MSKNFVPHQHCTVASGDCFTFGRCLRKCGSQRNDDHEARISELERRLRQLELALGGKEGAA